MTAIRAAKTLWGAVFLAATVSLVGTSAAIAALDAELYSAYAVIETEHDARVCGSAHDHALCVVWSGSKLHMAQARPVPPGAPRVIRVAIESPDLFHSVQDVLPANSRAPPTL